MYNKSCFMSSKFLEIFFFLLRGVILFVSGAELMDVSSRDKGERCFLMEFFFREEQVFKAFRDFPVAESRLFWKAKDKACWQYFNARAHCNSVKKSHVTEGKKVSETQATHPLKLIPTEHWCNWELKKLLFAFLSLTNF